MVGVGNTTASNSASGAAAFSATKPAARSAGAPSGRFLHRIGALLTTFPVALVLAFVGQFAFGGLIMAASPPPQIGAGAPEASIWLLVALLLLQGTALAFAVHHGRARPSRIFLALTALIWAVASLLLVYVAFQCDLGGVCL